MNDRVIKPLFGANKPAPSPSQPSTPHEFIQHQIANNPHVTTSVQSPVFEKVSGGVKHGEITVVASGTNVGKSSFAPVSPKQVADTGASSYRVVQLLSTFDSPTGILEYGQDVMTNIAKKADIRMDEVRDDNVEFVQTQMSSLLKMASNFSLHPSRKTSGVRGIINDIKSKFIDIKEEMLAEFNDISTQMDRIVELVDQKNVLILEKVKGLQGQYHDNLKDFNDLDNVIKDAIEALNIKQKEYEALKATMVSDPMAATAIDRLNRNLDRLDKKIATFKQFQLMCLQDAPDFANMEDSAVSLVEKFYIIKTLVIPLWKKQIRKYIDSQALLTAAKLGNAVDDKTNEMILASSQSTKDAIVQTAEYGQRGVIDASTAETVHANLISTLGEILTINEKGRQARITQSDRQDEMKRMYSQIASGQYNAEQLKALTPRTKG